MACDRGAPITCILTAILLLLSICPSKSSEQVSAYEMLESFGFPRGLLPTNVRSYTLNNADGGFAVYLDGSCSFAVESGYELKYRNQISGRISKGSVHNLKGVTVKVLFFWLSIDQVITEGNDLEFYAGLISANFPVSNFYESPQCGCGVDCADPLVAES